MKKLINTAFYYALAAMAGGVFFREFTKFNSYTAPTSLGRVHTHLFLLGALVMLITALFATKLELWQDKKFKRFYTLYNIGLPFMTIMMVVRGVLQVLNVQMSTGANAAISGISGIAHIITGVAIVFYFLSLKGLAANFDKT